MKQQIEEQRILWGDLDAAGIVFYPRYYEWIDDCAHLFFDSIGLNAGVLFEQRKLAFSLVESSCRYFLPGRYYQKVRIVTFIEELQEKTLILKHLISSFPSGELMVEGIEKRICVDFSDPSQLHAVAIPENILSILQAAFE